MSLPRPHLLLHLTDSEAVIAPFAGLYTLRLPNKSSPFDLGAVADALRSSTS